MSNQQDKWVLLFPGQGSQELNMGEALWRNDSLQSFLRALLEEAPEGLNSVREEGPLSRLCSNIYSSSAIYITSMLAMKLLAGRISVGAVLGYSVGQYAALVAAQVLSPKSGLKLVIERARLMDQESRKERQGMLAILGLSRDKIDQVLQIVQSEGERIYISNFNAALHTTVAGSLGALEKAEGLFKERRALKTVRLPVSGAWHSPLMRGAADDYSKLLDQTDLSPPQLPVIDNVTARILEPAGIKEVLVRHLYSPVRFHEGVQYCLQMGFDRFIEVGHGAMLQKIVHYIDRKIIVKTLTSF